MPNDTMLLPTYEEVNSQFAFAPGEGALTNAYAEAATKYHGEFACMEIE